MRWPDGQRETAVLVVVLLGVALAVVGGANALGGSHAPSGRTILNDSVHRYANAESVVGNATVSTRGPSRNASASVRYAVAGNESRVVVRTSNGTFRA